VRQDSVETRKSGTATTSCCRGSRATANKGPLDYESLAGLIMMTVHAHKAEDESRDLSRRTLGGMIRRAMALDRGRGKTSPCQWEDGYLFTHMLVCSECGAFLRGQPASGRRTYICAKYKDHGMGACYRNTVSEAPLKRAIIAGLENDILSPDKLDALEAEMERQLKAEQRSAEAERIQKQIATVDRDIAQGNSNLVRLPEDRLPGVITMIRQLEGERAGLVARLHDLENGATEMKEVLDEARKQLWRLREGLLDGDEEAQTTVIREVVSKIVVEFRRTRTHGKRSPKSEGRWLSKPTEAVVYVRPGIALSCLFNASGRNEGRPLCRATLTFDDPAALCGKEKRRGRPQPGRPLDGYRVLRRYGTASSRRRQP
jgi:hypothetical protein